MFPNTCCTAHPHSEALSRDAPPEAVVGEDSQAGKAPCPRVALLSEAQHHPTSEWLRASFAFFPQLHIHLLSL